MSDIARSQAGTGDAIRIWHAVTECCGSALPIAVVVREAVGEVLMIRLSTFAALRVR